MTLRDFASPYYLTRSALRREVADAALTFSGVLLDVGCGIQPYRDLFPNCDYIGVEVRQQASSGSAKRPDVFFDGRALPIRDASVDAVLCTQVLEHVANPAQFLSELRRVLPVGGRLLLTVPFVWDEHEQPYDYRRYTSFGLRHTLEAAGFRVTRQRKTLTNGAALVQIGLSFTMKVSANYPPPIRLAIRATAVGIANPLGWLLQRWGPQHPDLYLDNVVSCVALDRDADNISSDTI